MKRECLWFVVSILGSSLLWYLVASLFPEFLTSFKKSLSCLIPSESGGIMKSRFEVIACMDVLTIMVIYILRFTSWSKRLVKSTIKA